MVNDVTAAEQMADRLAAVRYDDAGAYRRQRSRLRLAREYLRRTAVWMQALDLTEGWPHPDLAKAIEPSLAVDPALAEKVFAATANGEFPVRPTVSYPILQWAAAGQLPKQRFPDLDDPFEPLVLLLERDGAFIEHNGAMELGYGEFQIRTVADRAALEPRPIDPAALDELDRKELV
ncbi:hypothetical protein BWI15_09670 [Kribbella sp. ALI-6-A]|uniref:hypothetical protein n=1 Tax=Kribbella sp. ALI-6-A TaxID=1933817 RepID=UPI00097C9B81|nr:hypothetical protein [Kribbella sp. ALI-6-A]ONI73694.1 hypothetical protein BWI15_09670 [Kribbella sp. ALI-6-A]